MKAPVRVPTAEEFAAYTGAHCHQLWKQVGPHWSCLCCRRSKFELLCWTKRTPGKCVPFRDWMAQLHEHHDHAPEAKFSRRFEALLIRGQCNGADGVAKSKLKLPSHFSFTPREISQFVTATPHGKHRLDLGNARQIYVSVKLVPQFF